MRRGLSPFGFPAYFHLLWASTLSFFKVVKLLFQYGFMCARNFDTGTALALSCSTAIITFTASSITSGLGVARLRVCNNFRSSNSTGIVYFSVISSAAHLFHRLIFSFSLSKYLQASISIVRVARTGK